MVSFGFLRRLTGHLVISIVLTSILNIVSPSNTGTAPYSLKVKKYVCIGTPYKESTLYSCKSILRRNAPTLVQLTLNVPKLYSNVVVKVMMFYKFSTYQPFMITIVGNACEFIRHPPEFGIEKHVYGVIEETAPELLAPCPIGNRIYNITWYLEERHAPKHLPAGEYKIQFQLTIQPNVTLFAMDVYVVVRNVGIVSTFITK
ncbi:uncharacterized protein LOC128718802 [Anopheles marshallii]|uniref:uncharacterized protein LOC128718802 n=1 Tax=Anopheles marshallii TaxID=1521116 RepID=UPI00237B9A74|nr:uncharacterized protein LOC128718802 [Anopheles marshallii]